MNKDGKKNPEDIFQIPDEINNEKRVDSNANWNMDDAPKWDEVDQRMEARRQVRYEKLRKREAFNNVVKKVAVGAVATGMVVAAVFGIPEVYKATQTDVESMPNVETKPATAITLTVDKGVDLDFRSDPNLGNSMDPSNALGQFENGSSATIEIESGEIYVSDPVTDGNGQWIGIPTQALVDGNYLSESEARGDKDGVAWVNNNAENGINVDIIAPEE